MLPLLLGGKKMRDYRKQLDEILEVVGLTDRKKTYAEGVIGRSATEGCNSQCLNRQLRNLVCR